MDTVQGRTLPISGRCRRVSGATINSPGYEGMACLSADNRELYFVSDRAGGLGGKDIWVSRFEEGLWQEPKNLGPQINTKADEVAPYLHMDNRTLYFASEGLQGMGGFDIHYARRMNDTTWGKPVNIGYPINSTADDTCIVNENCSIVKPFPTETIIHTTLYLRHRHRGCFFREIDLVDIKVARNAIAV